MYQANIKAKTVKDFYRVGHIRYQIFFPFNFIHSFVTIEVDRQKWQQNSFSPHIMDKTAAL